MPATLDALQSRYPGAVTFRFGDGPALCNRLLALVRSGVKRATCGRLQDYLDDPAAMPVIGRCDIATTWDSAPALIIRTRQLINIRYCDVTWDLARQEGEDEALSGWQEGHARFFARNGGFDAEMMLLFEVFDLVEDLAPPPGG